MESELQKYDSKCRVLNREVIAQERDKVAIQHKLDTTCRERDELAQNLRCMSEKLKALEASQVNCMESKQHGRSISEETELPDLAAEVVEQQSEAVIQDLTAKLETALEQLELERKKHKQTKYVMQSLWPSAATAKHS